MIVMMAPKQHIREHLGIDGGGGARHAEDVVLEGGPAHPQTRALVRADAAARTRAAEDAMGDHARVYLRAPLAADDGSGAVSKRVMWIALHEL